MRRPNVARMKRAMERDERSRLMRDRRVTFEATSDDAETRGRAWFDRVRRHFPDASASVWTDHRTGRVIAEWHEP